MQVCLEREGLGTSIGHKGQRPERQTQWEDNRWRQALASDLTLSQVAGPAAGEEYPTLRYGSDQGQGGSHGRPAGAASGLGLPAGLGPGLPVICECCMGPRALEVHRACSC